MASWPGGGTLRARASCTFTMNTAERTSVHAPLRVSEGGGRPKEVARFPTCFKGIGAATQLVRVARRRASWEDCTGWGFACAHATHHASEASDTPVPPTRTASTKSIPPGPSGRLRCGRAARLESPMLRPRTRRWTCC